MAGDKRTTGNAKSQSVEVLKPDFTGAEWRAVAPAFGSSKGLTAEEIGLKINHSAEWVRQKILRPGIANGKIVLGKRLTQRIDGRVTTVPVYSLTAG